MASASVADTDQTDCSVRAMDLVIPSLPASTVTFGSTRSRDPDFLDLDRAVLAQRQRAGLGHPAGLDRIYDRAR